MVKIFKNLLSMNKRIILKYIKYIKKNDIKMPFQNWWNDHEKSYSQVSNKQTF